MTEPTVSACLAVYNGSAYLERALKSMIEQTRPPDEIIVVDDGSSDDSASIAESFPAVRVIRQQNSGIGAARKRLVEEAKGDWIAFNDHDDWWTPDKLERLLPHTADPHVTLIYSAAWLVDESGRQTDAPFSVGPDAAPLRHILPTHSNILVPATLLRKRTLLDIGNYRVDLRNGEDSLAFFMLLCRGSVVQDPRRLAYITKRSDSTSAPRRASFEFERAVYVDHVLPDWEVLTENIPADERAWAAATIRRKVAHLDSLIGCWLDWEGDHKQALRAYLRSLKAAPAAKGNLYRLARSLLGAKVRPPGATG